MASSSRHLWVGGLPEEMDEAAIKEYFSKYGKIEGVKILPQRYPNIGLAAFIDFFDVKSAIEAKEAKHKIGSTELRTNFKTKTADKFDRREGGGGKWRDNQGEGEKHESVKSDKARGRDSSSSSSDSASSSSSSSGESESEEEGEGSRKKGSKRGGSGGGPLFIKVTSLANRSERILQDGLYYEFSRHSSSVMVRMYGEQPDKSHAVVKFKKSDECKAACKEAQGIVLFGSKIKLTLLDKDDFPPGGRDPPRFQHGPGGGPMGPGPHPFPQEELDPQATRSLFVGNIPKNISVYELRDIFQRFGNVLDVEIKKMSGNATYGFVLFYDLMDAVAAKQCMDGELVRGNKIRVGFGKGTASKTLWVDGIDPTMNEGLLERHMTKFGKVVRLGVDRHRHCAMVQFDTIESAKDAINSVKGTFIAGSKRIMADFANRDAKAAFFSRLESGEHPGPPPRGFPSGPGGMYNPGMNPRGGMMMPRGGMPMMGMGRGGFPPHGPPMDYFYPYMEEGMGYYGGGQPPFHGPGPMGMRRFSHGHGPYEEGFDDYEDELRAFSRKREWEKEREKRKERKKRRSTSSEEGEESDSDDSSSRRKKKSREKEKKKSGKKEKKSKEEKNVERSEGETDSGEEEQRREEVRLRATQRSRDLREKLKRKGRGKRSSGKEAKSDGEASSDGEESGSEKDTEHEVKKPSRKERARDKERSKDRDRERSKERSKDIDREKSRSSRKKDEKTSSRKKPPKTAESPPEKEKHSKRKKREKPSGKESKESGSEVEKANGREPPETPPPQVENGGEEMREAVQSPKLEETKLPVEVPKDESSEQVVDDGKTAEDSPQSPSPPGKRRSSEEEESASKPKLESDLSSGEDFRDEEVEPAEVKEATPPPPPREREKSEEREMREDVQKVEQRSRKKPDKQRSPRPKSPDSGSEREEKRSSTPPPPGKKPQRAAAEEEPEEKPASDSEARRSRKLPRQYKLEEEERRERQREPKDHRHPKRPPLPPTTPSPPPAFASQGHRRRRHFSPPHPEYFERRWHRRGRYHSPGPYGHRRHSRSPPPGYPPSPPHRPRSPYSGSPPPPRARTPIQRPGRDRGGPRYRFDSPPYDVPRGKYQRRGSPPSPPHRRYSPSPPLRPHSPPVRRHARHRSHSPSPPRRSPIHRRERSRSTESGRSSPHYPEDRYDSRRHMKRPPRSPSPKGKHREPAKEDYPEPKRRRVEESRPKSPSGTPPPPQEDTKPSRPEKSHQPPQPSASGGYSSEAPPPGSQRYRGSHSGGEGEYGHQGSRQQQAVQSQPQGQQASYRQGASELSRGSQPAAGGVARGHAHQAAPPNPQQADNLLDLLRRYPVMWQGHLMLKNESAAVQLHFLSGNVSLAKLSLPQPSEQHTPCLRIAQRMRLEQTQLEGVYRRIQNESEHCLLLALPCGRDANDVRAQTHALKNSLISYLLQKQAAGIINVQGPQTGFVLHIFPPCPFSQGHLSRVAPDLLSSASDNCHLMIVVATM